MPTGISIHLRSASQADINRASWALVEETFPRRRSRIITTLATIGTVAVVPAAFALPALIIHLTERRNEYRYIRNGLDTIRRAQIAAQIDERLLISYSRETRSLSIVLGDQTRNLLDSLRPEGAADTYYVITDELIAQAALVGTPDNAPLTPPAYVEFDRVGSRPPDYREQLPPPPAYTELPEPEEDISG